ncbi:MAG: 3-oxoacyl-[acyl-carrier-protein] reductase [Acidobacteriota bacterium]|nr:3-oxoacyl-[acyl-carrier-protein] reductase [Blastocatellia bacterium]MDW8413696.1 3-oxoacyl-[acyl-carrier-protein] reductase [Acidobacteriota bacterium]
MKVAIITGASRGIGRAIALELYKRGCNIVFNYTRSTQAAEELVKECTSTDRQALAYQVDAADFPAVQDMVKDVKSKLGRIDILVNNAGITNDKLIVRMKEEDWDKVLDTNLKSAFNFCRAVTPIMLKQESGRILNISSISGIVGMAGQANYSASKAGLIGLTKALAKELGSRNITVNALAPGMIETDMTATLSEDYKKSLLEQIPLRRFGQVDEIARIAAFLVSEDAAYITGQVIQVDGGLAM